MQRRHALSIDAALLAHAKKLRPGLTTTAIVDEALRTLIARDAAERLADLEGSVPDYRRPRRSPWTEPG
jgi:hypothetical protein